MGPLSSKSHHRRELWEDESGGRQRAPAGCHGEMLTGGSQQPLAFGLTVCLVPSITGSVFTVSYFLHEQELQISLTILRAT